MTDQGMIHRISADELPELLARVRVHIDLKRHQDERERSAAKLNEALAEVQALRSIIPICASCKKMRDDQGLRQQAESYIADHPDAESAQGLCSSCAD